MSEYPTSNSWMSSPWLNPFLTLIERPFSGANAPLAKAFLQCQWEIVTPIDIESSLHWWGPVELYATEQGAWHDLDCDACVFGGPVRSITLQGWRLNHQRCVDTSIAQESGPRLWTEVLLRSLKQNTEYTPSLVFGQSQIRAQPRKVGRASIKWSWSWIQRAYCSTLYGLPRP